MQNCARQRTVYVCTRQLSFTCGLLAFHCSEVAYFSAASVSRPLAVALSVVLRTRDMSLSATPQLYSAEWEDCFRFHAALYLSHACKIVRHLLFGGPYKAIPEELY